MNDDTKKIEALLFVAGEAVAKSELAALIKSNEATVEESLKELELSLADHGVALLLTITHAQLVTAPSITEFLGSFFQDQEGPLSKAAAETLALIAYRGPIVRFDIEAIRGVDSRQTLRLLKQRGLIVTSTSGTRVPHYDLSLEFFQHLGILRREDLPNFSVLSNHEKIREFLQSDKVSS